LRCGHFAAGDGSEQTILVYESGGVLRGVVEDLVRQRGGRLLLIETSDQGSFERTRQFYRRHGYVEAARIPDYFTDGDGKVSFVRRMVGGPDFPAGN